MTYWTQLASFLLYQSDIIFAHVSYLVNIFISIWYKNIESAAMVSRDYVGASGAQLISCFGQRRLDWDRKPRQPPRSSAQQFLLFQSTKNQRCLFWKAQIKRWLARKGFGKMRQYRWVKEKDHWRIGSWMYQSVPMILYFMPYEWTASPSLSQGKPQMG